MTDVTNEVWDERDGVGLRDRRNRDAPVGRPPASSRWAPTRDVEEDVRMSGCERRYSRNDTNDDEPFDVLVERPTPLRTKRRGRDKENVRAKDYGYSSGGDESGDDGRTNGNRASKKLHSQLSIKNRIGNLHADAKSLRRAESKGELRNKTEPIAPGVFASESTDNLQHIHNQKLWSTEDSLKKRKSFHEKGVQLKSLTVGEEWGDETKYAHRPGTDKNFSSCLSAGGVMDADCNFLKSWDMVTAVMLLFTAVVTPFELGFMQTNVESLRGLILFFVNRFVDLVFFIDIVIQMNTSTVDDKGRVIYNRPGIFKAYLQRWLLIDLVSIFPFELTLVILTGFKNPSDDQQKLKAVRFLRLLRLLKLLRVLRSSRIFERWQSRVTINYAYLNLQKYLVVTVLTAHWLGCVLFLTHQLLEPDCTDTEIATDRCTFLYTYMDDGRYVDDDMWQKYSLGMYFSFGELMGTPYGDIFPVRWEERIFFISAKLISGFVNAYLVGGMVSAISSLNAKNESFYRDMDLLNRFLTEKRLTAKNPKLCERLRAYYIFKHNVGGDAWGSIQNNTSLEMQGEVVQELHGDWLARVHFFHGIDRFGVKWEVDDEFKLQLSLSVGLVVTAPLECIFKEDSPIDKLFVIQKGLVGCQNKILRKGDPFGEDVFVYFDGEGEGLVNHSPLNRGTGQTRSGFETTSQHLGDLAHIRQPKDTLTFQDGTVYHSNIGEYRPFSNGRGYRATALINTVLMSYDGSAIHELLSRPRYAFVVQEVKRKTFRWQVRYVMKQIKEIMTKAVGQKTYGEGMHVLVSKFGSNTLSNVPSIRYHYMRLRELKGATEKSEVQVMRLFRSIWNKRRFKETIDELVFKRKRVNALREIVLELREFLKPLGGNACGYAETLIAHGVTVKVVKEFSVLELVTCGLPIVVAKHVFKASRNLPPVEADDFGEDGVAVDLRLTGGPVDFSTVFRELKANDDEINGSTGGWVGVSSGNLGFPTGPKLDASGHGNTSALHHDTRNTREGRNTANNLIDRVVVRSRSNSGRSSPVLGRRRDESPRDRM